MRTRQIIATIGLMAVNVFAVEHLERWTFDDASSRTLNELKNTGLFRSSFSWGDLAKWHTDNKGSLVVQGGAGTDWKAASEYAPDTLTPAAYSLNMTVSDWSIGPGTKGDLLKYCVKDSKQLGIVEIQFRVSSDEGASVTFSSARSNYRTYPILKDAPASARVAFDTAKGTVVYYLNGQATDSLSGIFIKDINQLGLSREGVWTNESTSIHVDELVFSRDRVPVPVQKKESVVSPKAVEKAGPYGQWAQDYGIKVTTGSDHDGDGLEDLFEYALGSSPIEKDIAGVLPRLKKIEFRGKRQDAYVFRRRIDHVTCGLIYMPEVTYLDASRPKVIGDVVRTERIDADFEYAFVLVPKGASVQLRIKIEKD